MSRPNYHDDPRQEIPKSTEPLLPVTEEQARTARRGSDMARVALGIEPKHDEESKSAFESEEAVRLQGLISRSDLSQPQIKNRVPLMVDAALQRGAISATEATGLLHYLDHAEGISDAPGRELDFRERQTGGS